MKEVSKVEEKDSMENVLGSDASNVLVSYLLEVIKLLHPSSHSTVLQDSVARDLYFTTSSSILSCLRIALVRTILARLSFLPLLRSLVLLFMLLSSTYSFVDE
jgi:hypothetical protein